jgi:5-formyltetrahydrofolate cyclo-ligase
MDIADSKRRMRAAAKSARAAACAAQTNAPMHLAARFLAEVPLKPEAVVGGYWPIGDEIDVRPLLQALHGEGMALALPAVMAPATPLAFHAWHPEDDLTPGGHDIPAPLPDAPLVIPDLLIVPLLAFDRQGWRLGYGAGYYDRTLEAFAAAGRTVMAVGVAFAAQEQPEVPHDGGDRRLDAVVTDKATYWFTDSRAQ